MHARVHAVQRHIIHEKPIHTITTNLEDWNAKGWNTGDLKAQVIGDNEEILPPDIARCFNELIQCIMIPDAQ